MTRRLLGPVGGPVLFFLIAALALAGLAWVTVAALRVEEAQRESAAQADLANNLHRALYRLDLSMTPSLTVEDSRPYFHYAPADPANGFGPGPTPLHAVTLPDWMRLHFQLDPDAGWQSPQVLDPAAADWLALTLPDYPLTNVTRERAACLAELNARYPCRQVAELLAARERAAPPPSTPAVPSSRAGATHFDLPAPDARPADEALRPPTPKFPEAAGATPAPAAAQPEPATGAEPESLGFGARPQSGRPDQADKPAGQVPAQPAAPDPRAVPSQQAGARGASRSAGNEAETRAEIQNRGREAAQLAAQIESYNRFFQNGGYGFGQGGANGLVPGTGNTMSFNIQPGAGPQGGATVVPPPPGPGGTVAPPQPPTVGLLARGLGGGGGFGGMGGAVPPAAAPPAPAGGPAATGPAGPPPPSGAAPAEPTTPLFANPGLPGGPAGPPGPPNQMAPAGDANRQAKDVPDRVAPGGPGIAGGGGAVRAKKGGGIDAKKLAEGAEEKKAAPEPQKDTALGKQLGDGDAGKADKEREPERLGRSPGERPADELMRDAKDLAARLMTPEITLRLEKFLSPGQSAPGRGTSEESRLRALAKPDPPAGGAPPAEPKPDPPPVPNLAVVTPPPLAVHLGSMRPQWLTAPDGGELLVLVRAARLGNENRTVYQGVVLDWPRLEEELRDEVRDLFPEAKLVPVKDPAAASPERAMTALPVQLDPGLAPALPPAGWTPLRMGLVLAWAAAVIAFTAVALAGWSLLDLAERRIRFVSAVTHELRTPLTSLRLYLDLLLSGMVRDEQKRTEYLATLNAESDRLHRLIDNVLDFARLERRRTKADRQAVKVGNLLDQVRQTWADRCGTDGKELVVISTLPPDQEVCTDPHLVGQILGNLVDNARKYARHAADPRIWLWAKPGGRKWVVFEVEDRGPGVPPGERGTIFRPFRRGEAADTIAGGAGLGLALAKQWAEALGGRLTYRPADGGVGACFRLELRVR